MKKIFVIFLVLLNIFGMFGSFAFADDLNLNSLITDSLYYNYGLTCNFQFNIQNTSSYNVQNVPFEIKVMRGTSEVSLTGTQKSVDTTTASANNQNTQYRSFLCSNAGEYTITVWIYKGTPEEETLSKTVYVYATDVAISTDKQVYSKYDNENINMYATVTNINANASNYTIELYLISPSGNVFVETNSTNIDSLGHKTLERTYRVKSTDKAGSWTYKVRAFPVGKSSAVAEQTLGISVEDINYTLNFQCPVPTKYNFPVYAYALVGNTGVNPIYVDVGFAIFATYGSGGALATGKLENVQVQSTSGITGVSTITMNLQQMADRQFDLPIGTYNLQLYGKIRGTDIVMDLPCQLQITENLPNSNYGINMVTQKPQVNEDVELEFILSNMEFDDAVTYDNIMFYIYNPSEFPAYSMDYSNVKLTGRGTYGSAKRYYAKFKPSVTGTYTAYIRINKGSEKQIGTFNVATGSPTRVSISNVSFSPSANITQQESTQLTFTVSNSGGLPEVVDYSVKYNNETIGGVGGSVTVGGDTSTQVVKRTINGNQFNVQENIPIEIVLNGDFPEVRYQANLTVTYPSGSKSEIVVASMDSYIYEVGKSGVLNIRIKNPEEYTVTNYVTVTYPSDGSVSGEARRQVDIEGGATRIVPPIYIKMNSVKNGAGITVNLEGTHGEGADLPVTLRFDILTPEEFVKENSKSRSLAYFKGLATTFGFIIVGIIVGAVILYMLFIKKKKVVKEEDM